MAEGWTQKVRCRYYSHGMCREGDNCRYLHQGPSSSNSDRIAGTGRNSREMAESSQPYCWFYQRGSCAFGQRCRFTHSRVEEELPGASTSRPSSPDSPARSNFSARRGTPARSNSQQRSSLRTPTARKQETTSKEGRREKSAEYWANAPEFVPAANDDDSEGEENVPASYADVVSADEGKATAPLRLQADGNKLCPYLKAGECKYGGQCPYLHGDICELCGQACLNPFDQEQRKKHITDCIKQHEQDMELSFAIARSRDKTCGVCFEVVMEKSPREQRFGILPNCNHCFCLSCIRKWRQAKQFDNKIIRACPECRVKSDFVCPSMYWVDTKEEKEKLITDYKGALSVKDCKYFKSGQGKCPFGNKCFYLHAYPDGTKCDVGPPPRRRPRRIIDSDVPPEVYLANYLDHVVNRWMYNIDNIEDLLGISDSEESDWSEYDLFFD